MGCKQQANRGANSKQKKKKNKKEKRKKWNGTKRWDPRRLANGATPRCAPGPHYTAAAGGGQYGKACSNHWPSAMFP
jgi:hypothetical protein